MKQKKTFSQKLEKVPEPIKSMIIERIIIRKKRHIKNLQGAFVWFCDDFEESFDFWEAVHCEIENKNEM